MEFLFIPLQADGYLVANRVELGIVKLLSQILGYSRFDRQLEITALTPPGQVFKVRRPTAHGLFDATRNQVSQKGHDIEERGLTAGIRAD